MLINEILRKLNKNSRLTLNLNCHEKNILRNILNKILVLNLNLSLFEILVRNQVILEGHHFEHFLRKNRHQIVELVIQLKSVNLIDVLNTNIKSLMFKSQIIVKLNWNQSFRIEMLNRHPNLLVHTFGLIVDINILSVFTFLLA